MTFASILSGLVGVPGALAAAVLDPQGQTVAQEGECESVEVLGAYQSVWLAELGGVANRSGLGGLSEVSMDFDSRKVFTAEITDGYFLLVVLDASGLSSLIRARLEAVRSQLAAEIG